MINPYLDKDDKAFWKRSVSGRNVTELADLFDGVPNISKAKIATAGSCFAQHIGRNLRSRDMHYMDYEPAPAFLTDEQADSLGYGVYSCRYGNVYTVRQLWQLFQEAFGMRQPEHSVWTRAGRYYDALRPGLQPGGFDSIEELRVLRAAHLKSVRSLFTDLDIFVFTLGLTEAWVDSRDGTVFPIAPGVIAGEYDADIHTFENFRYPEIYADLEQFIEALKDINPTARIILTISPVSLAATATDNHVLVATTHSKSTLRAVAGDLASDRDNVIYFPAYEIITGQPTRHQFYEDNLRNVKEEGVDEVMKHFFSGDGTSSDQAEAKPQQENQQNPDVYVGYEHCEESLVDGR